MELVQLIAPENIVPEFRASNKKQALKKLSKRAATRTGFPPRQIYEAFANCEKMGTTGIGDGIGIPQCRLQGLEKFQIIFARLPDPIDFDAIDEQPVDLICAFLAPEESSAEYLVTLAKISHLLRDRAICEKLRITDNADAIYMILMESIASQAA